MNQGEARAMQTCKRGISLCLAAPRIFLWRRSVTTDRQRRLVTYQDVGFWMARRLPRDCTGQGPTPGSEATPAYPMKESSGVQRDAGRTDCRRGTCWAEGEEERRDMGYLVSSADQGPTLRTETIVSLAGRA